MKSLTNYITEGTSEEWDALKGKFYNAGEDATAVRMLRDLINNWYHFCWLHSRKQNNQAYHSNKATSFRNAIKHLVDDWTDPHGTTIKAHSDEVKGLVNDVLDSIKNLNGKDFQELMDVFEKVAPKVVAVGKKAEEIYQSLGKDYWKEWDIQRQNNKEE